MRKKITSTTNVLKINIIKMPANNVYLFLFNGNM